MDTQEPVKVRRRVGRPRANGGVPKGDPHGIILKAAGLLFA